MFLSDSALLQETPWWNTLTQTLYVKTILRYLYLNIYILFYFLLLLHILEAKIVLFILCIWQLFLCVHIGNSHGWRPYVSIHM